MSDEVLANLRTAETRARDLGDGATAKAMNRELAAKLKKGPAKSGSIRHYMRVATVQRRRAERKEVEATR